MEYTITYRGAPVGNVEFTATTNLVVTAVRPLGGYSELRSVVRAASVALADVALAGRISTAERVALDRSAALGRALELRDRAGGLVPTDFIELTEWTGGEPEVAATVRFRDAHAAAPVQVYPHPRAGSDVGSDAGSPNSREHGRQGNPGAGITPLCQDRPRIT